MVFSITGADELPPDQWIQLLTSIDENIATKHWCFRNNYHAYNILKYGKYITRMHYNLVVYSNIIRGIYPACDINDYYQHITPPLIGNTEFAYIVQVFENTKCVDKILLMVNQYGKYYYTYGKHREFGGWPPFIPDTYKSKVQYKAIPPYILTEITNDNISVCNDQLCVENKPVNEYGYYVNVADSVKYINGYIELHFPFNVGNIEYYKSYISNNTPLKIVGDNIQLINNSTITIIDSMKLVDKSQIINYNDIIILDKPIQNINLIQYFKQTIF